MTETLQKNTGYHVSSSLAAPFTPVAFPPELGSPTYSYSYSAF